MINRFYCFMIMDRNINEKQLSLEDLKFKKMVFLYNALENGWTVKKNKEFYIFNKAHGGKKEVYLDDYLKKFLNENINLEKIF